MGRSSVSDTLSRGLTRLADLIRWRERRIEAAWGPLAERRGGVFTPCSADPSGLPFLEVPVGDAAVGVDLFVGASFTQVGGATLPFTQLRAAYVLGFGPLFRVIPRSLVDMLGAVLGRASPAPGFGGHFELFTGMREAAELAWTPRARRCLVEGLGRRAQVIANGRMVTVLIDGVVIDEAVLDLGLDLAGELAEAGWGPQARARLGAGLPGAVLVPPAGPWDDRSRPCVRLERRGVTVTLTLASPDADLLLEVEAQALRSLEIFDLRCDAWGRPELDAPAGVLGATAADLLPAVGECRLAHDGVNVRITLAGEPSSRRAELAAELAATIALGDGVAGVFR
jgi:hypothetical protein